MESEEPNIEDRYRTILFSWFGMSMSVMFLLFMTFAPVQTTTTNQMLSVILNCAGIIPVGASFLLKQQVLAQAISEQKIDRVRKAYMLAFALCEASALLATVDHFVNGAHFYYLGFVIALLGLLLHFPQNRHLLDASNQQM